MARLLIVDDEPSLRNVLREVLTPLGYECHEAAHGLECLELLDAGLKPDVILLDLLMPVMTGAQVIEAIRDRDGMPPVIVMSGYFDREEFAGIRAFERFVKPVNVDQIVLAIERALAVRGES